MIKRILLPLDPSAYTETALEIACFIAEHHEAELTGMVCLDIHGIEKSVEPAPIGAIHYAEKLESYKKKEAGERIEQLLNNFKKVCEHKRLKHREAEIQGGPSQSIIRESIYYDAVIIGMQTFFNFETTDKPSRMLHEIIDHTITPIYAVPEQYSLPDQSERKIRVLVAFDGSLPAARAVHQFAQLALPDLMEVLLLTSIENRDEAADYMDQVESYLNAYHISRVSKKIVSEDILEVIRDGYIDWTDFFVIGAHSKPRLLDFVMGGLTRRLMKMEKKPMLIGQ
jgi:nucleotide-binding universal stress UspA family protein